MITSDTSGLWFKSCHLQNLYRKLFTINCQKDKKRKEKEVEIGPIDTNSLLTGRQASGPERFRRLGNVSIDADPLLAQACQTSGRVDHAPGSVRVLHPSHSVRKCVCYE